MGTITQHSFYKLVNYERDLQSLKKIYVPVAYKFASIRVGHGERVLGSQSKFKIGFYRKFNNSISVISLFFGCERTIGTNVLLGNFLPKRSISQNQVIIREIIIRGLSRYNILFFTSSTTIWPNDVRYLFFFLSNFRHLHISQNEITSGLHNGDLRNTTKTSTRK